MFQRKLLLETFRNNETSSNFEIARIPRRKVILPETVKNFAYFVESCSRCINLSKQSSCFLSLFFSPYKFLEAIHGNVLREREERKKKEKEKDEKEKVKKGSGAIFLFKMIRKRNSSVTSVKKESSVVRGSYSFLYSGLPSFHKLRTF